MKGKPDKTSTTPPKRAPRRSPEAREKQLISYAVDLAEEQLRNGTASSQIICHYLKLASAKEGYEVEKLKADVALSKAKADSYQAMKQSEEKFDKVIEAFKRYSMPIDNYQG